MPMQVVLEKVGWMKRVLPFRTNSCKMKEKVWSRKTLSSIEMCFNSYRLRVRESDCCWCFVWFFGGKVKSGFVCYLFFLPNCVNSLSSLYVKWVLGVEG